MDKFKRKDSNLWIYATNGMGNILGLEQRIGCAEQDLILANQTITDAQAFSTCAGIEADGAATFTAGTRSALGDGFSVQNGASFTAGVDPAFGTSVTQETYAYQDYQYFLEAAAGPWGAFAWTHDQIGNRLTETHDAVTDTYAYQSNAAAGNTALLTQITLGAGGTRDYQFGKAGHLELVTAGANEVDFVNDEEGRLGQLARPVASETAYLLYDGRSYLQSASDPGTGATTRPAYSSEGLLHALTRQEGPTEPVEHVLYLHFAGRPVAQLSLDGLGGQALLFLTTDHLGTPEVAVNAAGTTVWDSAFEPFGRDAEEATPQGATANGIFLRFPGQWDDGRWEGAALGAGVFYNVHRWYSAAIGLYSRPDPINFVNSSDDTNPLSTYLYGGADPVTSFDPLGMYQVFGPLPFQGRVEGGMAQIRRNLSRPDASCCRKYFSGLGINIDEWVQEGGKPFIRSVGRRNAEEMARKNACGFAQSRSPFLWIFLRPSCSNKLNPCEMASLLMHELGHLARKDTDENEPEDFFTACTIGCVRPGDFD